MPQNLQRLVQCAYNLTATAYNPTHSMVPEAASYMINNPIRLKEYYDVLWQWFKVYACSIFLLWRRSTVEGTQKGMLGYVFWKNGDF